MATVTNLEAIRGDTKTFNITVSNNINVTGYTFRLTVKKPEDFETTDAQAVLTKSWNTHQGNHQTSVTLTATDTAFAIGSYKYDIQMSNVAGNVYTILIGDWEHINDVTKTV